MPWTAKDVDSHKKGLTPAQKKKWVSVANGVYRECMKSGTDKTCAAKAIRIANSKFSEEGEMTTQLKKLPKGALRFVDVGHECTAFAEMDGEKPKLRMKAYSGKEIKGHWYWGNLALDTEGMKVLQSKTPILENHDTSRKIAFTTGITVEDHAVILDSDKTTFVDTEESREFQKLSSEGFPYQCSVAGEPSVVEWVKEGSSVEVNGFSLKGPGAVWRQWGLKEASVCVFGWDSKTSASAFSRTEMEEVELTEIREGGDPATLNMEGGDVGTTTDYTITWSDSTNTFTYETNAEEEVKKLVQTQVIPELHRIREEKAAIWRDLFNEMIKSVFSEASIKIAIPLLSLHFFPDVTYLELVSYGISGLLSQTLKPLLSARSKDSELKSNSLFFVLDLR